MKLKPLLKDKNVLRIVVFVAIVNLLGYVMIKDFNAVVFFAIAGFLATYYTKNMIIVALIAMVATNVMVVMKRKTYEGLEDKQSIATPEEIAAVVGAAAEAAYSSGEKGDSEDERREAVKKAIDELNLAIDAAVVEAIIVSLTQSDVGTSVASLATKAITAANSANVPKSEPSTPQPEESSTQSSTQPSTQPADSFANKTDENASETLKTASSLTDINADTESLIQRQAALLAQYEKLQPALEKSYKLLNAMGGSEGVQGMVSRVGDMIDKFGSFANGIKKT